MLEVGCGVLRDLSKNILKQGVGKGERCSSGEGGFEGVTTPPPENFNGTPLLFDWNCIRNKKLVRQFTVTSAKFLQKNSKLIAENQLKALVNQIDNFYH